MARTVLGLQNWSMMDAIAMQPREEGGIGMILPSTYPLYIHSQRYIRWMRDPESLTSEGRRELDGWREGRLGDRLSRVHLQLASRPVVYGEARDDKPWPAVSTSAKAYGDLGTSMRGLSVPRRDILKLPLWNSTLFRSAAGPTYQCTKLMKQGVQTVEHMIYEGTLDENKMEQIPHRWITWLVREWASIDKELVIPGPRLPEA